LKKFKCHQDNIPQNCLEVLGRCQSLSIGK
jgi:hypothetical protein